MLIAHHLGSTQADALQGMLPRAVELKSLLGPDPWAVPEGVEVVITQPEDMLPDTYPAWQRRPSHWPGGVRWVHLRSTGVDRYPSWVFDAPMVTTSSGSQATSISEYVLSAILAQEKRGQQLAVANPKMWIETRERVRNRPVGGLEGKVLGLVGFGHIGKAVASRAKPFGMKVIASNRSGSPSADAPKVEMLALDDVVRRADHLVIAVPLDASTRALIGRALLAQCRLGVHVVNVARGAVLETDALLHALDEGRVGHATLDVTDPEPLPLGHRLYSHASVTLTPHIAFSGPSTERRGNQLFSQNLQRFLSGEALHQVTR